MFAKVIVIVMVMLMRFSEAQFLLGTKLQEQGRKMYSLERGNVNTGSITTVMVGLLFMVIGLALLTTIMTSASTAGSSAVAGSFTNATSISDLAPLVFAAVVIVGGASMIGLTVFRVAKGE